MPLTFCASQNSHDGINAKTQLPSLLWEEDCHSQPETSIYLHTFHLLDFHPKGFLQSVSDSIFAITWAKWQTSFYSHLPIFPFWKKKRMCFASLNQYYPLRSVSNTTESKWITEWTASCSLKHFEPVNALLKGAIWYISTIWFNKEWFFSMKNGHQMASFSYRNRKERDAGLTFSAGSVL